MKNKWRILKILVTVILFGFLLHFSLKRFNNSKMNKISVNMIVPENREKVYFIDEKDIKEYILKSNPTEEIGNINIPALEKEISKLPAIDSANVYLSLNGMLNIDIQQRVPSFRLSKNGKDFYVDEKGIEFPLSNIYSHPSMLVTGNVSPNEYTKVVSLVKKINEDDFCRKYFVGISKEKEDYNLVTSEGNFKVEIGDLDNIEFKIKGFKTFAEKFLVFQDQNKYSKISVKFDNQIITTLNPYFEENDSILKVRNKELSKIPELALKKAQALRKTE